MAMTKVALVGDSYCFSVDEGSWPWHFCTLANMQPEDIIHSGVCGQSFWTSVYQNPPQPSNIERMRPHPKKSNTLTFDEIVVQADFIIFCVSGHDRLPNRHNLPLRVSTQIEGFEPYVNSIVNLVGSRKHALKINEASMNYHDHLYNDEWHQTAQRGTIHDVNNVMLENNKKCFWMECFQGSFCNAKITSGPIYTVPLSTFSEKDKPFVEKEDDDHWFDNRHNHMTAEDNKMIGSLVFDVWTKLNTGSTTPYPPLVIKYS
jgi:hypothetical protein